MKVEFDKYIEISRIIWYFFKPYKLKAVIVCCSIFIVSIFDTLNLAVLYPLMSYGLKQETQGFILVQFYKIISIFGTGNLFLSSCVLLLIVTLLANLLRYFNNLIQYKLLAEIETSIQEKIVDIYLKADYSFFTKNKQGKLVHAATIATAHVGNIVLYATRTFNDLTTFLLMAILLLILSSKAAIIASIVGLAYFFFIKRIMVKIIYRCGLLSAEASREKNVILNELINGIKPIKIFLSYKFWETKYHNLVKAIVLNHFRMLMGRVFPESFMKAASYMLLAIIGIFISIKTKGSIISFIPLYGTLGLVATRLSPLVNILGSDFMILAESLPNTKIIYDLFNERTQNIPDGKERFAGLKKDIMLKDVWFKYEGTEKVLFKGINFTIEKDKVTAIVGFSGSGKSTLVSLLLRLYPLGKGNILIDEIDISKYSFESYLSKIGYVSQETFIYNDTIKENIRFGMVECTDQMIEEAAKQANAHDFIISMPKRYDTLVGDSGIKLSGGQRQRIAIARAILRKPEILVLDEATSSLDNISERKVREAINRVSLHTTVLIIAHRLSTVSNADKILVLENGSIREEGTHNELIKGNGLYFKLYNQQKVLEPVKEDSSENI